MSAYWRKRVPILRDGFVVAAEALQYLAGKVRELKDEEDIDNLNRILNTITGKELIKEELEREAQRIEGIAAEFNERNEKSRKDPQREMAWREDYDVTKPYDKLVCQALTVYSYDLVESRTKILERLRMTDDNPSILEDDEHSFKMENLENLMAEIKHFKEAYCRSSSTKQP